MLERSPNANQTTLDEYHALGKDKLRWCRAILRIHLVSYQAEIIAAATTHRRTVVRSGHGLGKSFTAAALALAYAFTEPDSIVVTTAPTNRQVKNILWREIRRLYNAHLAPMGANCEPNLTELWIDAAHSWGIFGFSTDDPNQIQGVHARRILIIVDEAPGVPREIMTALLSLSSNENAHLLLIGNPTESAGTFYDAFRNPGWHRIHLSCMDSPNFTGEKCPDSIKEALVGQAYVEQAKLDWGEGSSIYASRVLGEFPVEGDDSLIPLAWAEGATRREITDNGRPRYLGVDVARFGDDRTVYMARFGGVARILAVEHGRDTMQVAGRVAALRSEYDFDAIAVDDIGVGGGVTDRLREQGIPVVAVNVGESALDGERFANRRAELWWLLREWIRDAGGIPDDGNLLADVTAPKFRYTSRGQILLEKKDETKKRLGRSPDYGDALMLTFGASQAGNAGWFESAGLGKPRTADVGRF